MMIDPDRFADALYATPPLDVVETRIVEMLAAAENEGEPAAGRIAGRGRPVSAADVAASVQRLA